MANLATTRSYLTGDLLLDTDFNAFLDDIELFLNDTKINNDNIQDQGVNAALKAASASITTQKLSDEIVTSEKLTENNLTQAVFAADNITTIKLADNSISTADLLDSTVTTVDLSAAAGPAIRTLTSISFYPAGNYSWTVPPNVTQLIIEGCGGGGGGGGGGGSGARSGLPFLPSAKEYASKPGLGGGAGGSSYIRQKRLSVTPGQIFSIIVGAGGAGGAGGLGGNNFSYDSAAVPGRTLASNGSAGGESAVNLVGGGNLVTFPGGGGGGGGRCYAVGYETPVPGYIGLGGSYEGGNGFAASGPGPLIGDGGSGGNAKNCGTQDADAPQGSITGSPGQSTTDYTGGNGGGGNGYPWFSALGTPGCGGGGGGGAGSADNPLDDNITYGSNGGQGRAGMPGLIRIWY